MTAPELSTAGLKLALASYDLGSTWTVDDLIGRARGLGFAGLELRTEIGHAHGVETGLAAEARRDVKHRIEDANLEIACLSTGVRFDAPEAAARRAAVDVAKAHIDLAGDVGALAVRVFGNNLTPGIARDESIANVATCLQELGLYGQGRNVDVLFEMHGDFKNRHHTRRVMDLVASDRVGIMFNSDARSDTTGGSVLQVLSQIGPRLRYVQLHDLTSGFPYGELLGWLRDNKFSGYISPELWTFKAGDANGPIGCRGEGAFPTPEDYLALYVAHVVALSAR